MLSSCNFIKPWLNEERNNILITSVGRRSYMVQYFKEALGNSGEVHVSNSSTITPAFRLADKAVKSPLIYDKDYIPFLLNYCKENQIGALLPLFDIDIPVLASAKNLFLEIGCFQLFPIQILRKFATINYFHASSSIQSISKLLEHLLRLKSV